jgi:hypothetical protein
MYHLSISMRIKSVWVVICLFLLPGCVNPLGTVYDISVIQEGVATEDLDLIVVLQLDTTNASIAFSEIHVEVGGPTGAALGCTDDDPNRDDEGCTYEEQGDMDGIWEEGEGLAIYETRNWCDSTCTELSIDVSGKGYSADIVFNPDRIQFQMQ